jgi:hypothetical protein
MQQTSGYGYDEMVEIWYAANWTQTDIIGMWWRPEALYQQFQETAFELEEVMTPPCFNKIVSLDRSTSR